MMELDERERKIQLGHVHIERVCVRPREKEITFFPLYMCVYVCMQMIAIKERRRRIERPQHANPIHALIKYNVSSFFSSFLFFFFFIISLLFFSPLLLFG